MINIINTLENLIRTLKNDKSLNINFHNVDNPGWVFKIKMEIFNDCNNKMIKQIERSEEDWCSAPLLVNVKLGEYFCYLVEC